MWESEYDTQYTKEYKCQAQTDPISHLTLPVSSNNYNYYYCQHVLIAQYIKLCNKYLTYVQIKDTQGSETCILISPSDFKIYSSHHKDLRTDRRLGDPALPERLDFFSPSFPHSPHPHPMYLLDVGIGELLWTLNFIFNGWISTCLFGLLRELHETITQQWRRKWQPTPAFLPGKSHVHGVTRIGHDLATKPPAPPQPKRGLSHPREGYLTVGFSLSVSSYCIQLCQVVM